MDLKQLAAQIVPCDMDRPFAFVSYSSKDSDRVWKDVYTLQKMGFNIWVDLELKATEGSWKKALEAIMDINCSLLLFYMSENSVASEPCLEELRTRSCEKTRLTHNDHPVPMVPIEVAPIGDVVTFRNNLYQKIKGNTNWDKAVRMVKAQTLTILMKEFFPNNDNLRMLSENDPTRRTDYYPELETYLLNNQIRKESVEEKFQHCVSLLRKPAYYRKAMEGLAYCAGTPKYLPAMLLLGFIYNTGICGYTDKAEAKRLLEWATFQVDDSEWKKKGDQAKNLKKYEEAVAFYSGYAVYREDVNGYLEACKMWIKVTIASQDFAKRCAEEAVRLGNAEAVQLSMVLKELREDKFLEFAAKNR